VLRPAVPSDIEIAQQARLRPITDVAADLGLAADEIDQYGRYKAKLPLALASQPPRGRLVLVTAINPTPAGEGKSTVSVGLTQALKRLGTNAILCMREPSLGPVFGVKGGAAGGGYAQVVPMEDINLHFTGDFHAISSAHSLLSALLDNHLQHGNALGFDTKRISWPRTIDMNDRALRHAIIGLGAANGAVREERWVIIPASEVMAILALASNAADLEQRLGNILVGSTHGPHRHPIRARALKATGAMSLLLKDAVLVATVRSLKMQGGAHKSALDHEDLGALERGLEHLDHHIANVRQFGVPVVVAINVRLSDTDAELQMVADQAARAGAPVALCNVWAEGGAGGEALAREVLALLDGGTADFRPLYDATFPIREKINTIATRVYGADGVDFSPAASRAIDYLESIDMGATPVCIAKTQYSLTDDPTRLGRPRGFRISINDVYGSAGAGFVVAKAGDIMTMPGLGKEPAAEKMRLRSDGTIEGLS